MSSRREKLECILLVDDDDMTNFINRKVIEQTKINCRVEVAISGYEALDFLTSSGKFAGAEFPSPGIIFLDINMPGISGWDFMDRYQQLPQEQKAEIVIAMLTTSENPADKEKADKINEISQFFSKPLTTKKVLSLVEEYWPASLPQ